MKCFWHSGADAVAQCSQCGKGICVNCAHPFGDVTYCPDCAKSGVQTEITQYRRTLTGMKIFCALVTVVSAFIAISAISSGADFVLILIVPGAFLLSWCLYWGWSSAWHGFRRVLGGWGVFGSWMFVLVVVILCLGASGHGGCTRRPFHGSSKVPDIARTHRRRRGNFGRVAREHVIQEVASGRPVSFLSERTVNGEMK